jgi:maltooligosyltrehalose trehalohydrolase
VEAHLPYLAELGITAVELMPIAHVFGERNWGYDGVLPYAPNAAYGTPDELKRLVDRAHALGLMVFLDVVYNHFGPVGNYLPHYAPHFFRDDRHTPWGPGIDFQNKEVRRFFIENAIYWIREFRIDGLRLDAVHAIENDDFLVELAGPTRASAPGRHVHLVVKNERNDADLLARGDLAQWNDDFHHVVHVMLTGETGGY